ncbi:uncharacterized protein LAESUDRAFT_763591 [Laetiporus sulphureus 93-53]|uniref:Uncharacterized protein n=1 Tax=Laetiporus sulphureus 93-53 TaxID=1314785 RepID=A0A165BSU0_9APHY|nr:uncharacterized protein LAESUDRAFT_763591 [Laetiporus sulphureus 93-53]KZT01583.1 hypothetical protein LAESUDRAFT_763591 [Laetiporus sulphureus 93-53]
MEVEEHMPTVNKKALVKDDMKHSTSGLPGHIIPNAQSTIMTNVSSSVIVISMNEMTQHASGAQDLNISGSKNLKLTPSSDSKLSAVASSEDAITIITGPKSALVVTASADFESDSIVSDALSIITADISGDIAYGRS